MKCSNPKAPKNTFIIAQDYLGVKFLGLYFERKNWKEKTAFIAMYNIVSYTNYSTE